MSEEQPKYDVTKFAPGEAPVERRTGFEMQREFHEAFGHPVSDEPGLPNIGTEREAFKFLTDYVRRYLESSAESFYELAKKDNCRRSLRVALLLEEVAEYLHGESVDNLTSIFDGLVDTCVIVEGTALEYGLPLDKGREEVHRANMSKLGADGKPIHNEAGKIVKGPNYTPPDLKQFL